MTIWISYLASKCLTAPVDNSFSLFLYFHSVHPRNAPHTFAPVGSAGTLFVLLFVAHMLTGLFFFPLWRLAASEMNCTRSRLVLRVNARRGFSHPSSLSINNSFRNLCLSNSLTSKLTRGPQLHKPCYLPLNLFSTSHIRPRSSLIYLPKSGPILLRSDCHL